MRLIKGPLVVDKLCNSDGGLLIACRAHAGGDRIHFWSMSCLPFTSSCQWSKYEIIPSDISTNQFLAVVRQPAGAVLLLSIHSHLVLHPPSQECLDVNAKQHHLVFHMASRGIYDELTHYRYNTMSAAVEAFQPSNGLTSHEQFNAHLAVHALNLNHFE